MHPSMFANGAAPFVGAASRISPLLILASVLAVSLSSSPVAGIDLKKSLSMLDGFNKLTRHEQPVEKVYATDDSLITVRGKSNKVSKALRYLHNKSGDIVYKRNGSVKQVAGSENGERQPLNYAHDNYDRGMLPVGSAPKLNTPDGKTDDQVIQDACNGHPTRTCRYAVKAALKSKPDEKARIALALHRKPEYVDSSKLLYHKLFESAINKVEEKGIDSKLDMGLDLVIDKTPYGFVANQALNMAVKRL